MTDESDVVCSFCGKGKDDVERIIAGPNVAICVECVDLCAGIVHEDADQRGPIKGDSFKGDPCEVDKVTIGPFVGKWILESTAKEGKIAEGKKVLVFTEFGRMTLKTPSPSLFSNKYYAFRATTDSLMLTALDLRSEWPWQAKFTESGKLILGSGQSQETYMRKSNG